MTGATAARPVQEENIGNGVMVPATLLATLNKNYGFQPNKLTRHLMHIVFTVEERRGKSLNGKACNARKDIPAKQCIDKEKMDAIITFQQKSVTIFCKNSESGPSRLCSQRCTCRCKLHQIYRSVCVTTTSPTPESRHYGKQRTDRATTNTFLVLYI
ncbi:hypothetical protein HPB47_016204 [Ixodes persulcatus]|uniref:Uncharacterized protein n=1 Tax=Ixodes persulcatus TaxID=34615 RepID=A0AC60QRG2_IXOPE|nr:hypothetical protein HPB47_016204 [Ixodes persulcatus]